MKLSSISPDARGFVAAILAGALAGCAGVKNDSDRTRAEGAAAGAALGAAAGAGTAALLKQKHGGVAAGAAAGALAGGVAGAAYGNAVAKKKEGYAAQETALDAQLTGLKHQIAVKKEYNDKLREIVSTKEKQLASILASDRTAGPTALEFDLRTTITAKLEEIDGQARTWQETIDAHKAVLKKATTDPHSSDLQSAIDELSEQRAELLRERARLATIPDRLKQ